MAWFPTIRCIREVAFSTRVGAERLAARVGSAAFARLADLCAGVWVATLPPEMQHRCEQPSVEASRMSNETVPWDLRFC